jgi:hypothetical protein
MILSPMERATSSLASSLERIVSERGGMLDLSE